MRALHWSLVSVLLCFICLLPEATQSKNASFATHGNPKYILFVNQVRGGECCDPGNTSALNQQLETFAAYKLPATFALRYDALNQKFLQTFEHYPREHEVAAFLEITPSLAHDAQVLYAGTAQNWYKAKYSYLIGYEPEDRVKLIDAYMEKFAATVGHFPKTTVAWMIDPLSLAYVAEQYGVVAHQITREQWGTDSYTLYGGPSHYPYHPSPNWALVPSQGDDATMPVIFRQTVSDPLRNYGDFTSAFTSQPNDYLSGGNDFDYFKRLINQTLSQPGNEYAIAILGLENSMDQSFQAEYAKQIEYIRSLAKTDSNLKVLTAEKLPNSISDNSPSVVSGTDLSTNTKAQAWWITTDSYRLRLRFDGTNLMINDIRLYNRALRDPYFDNSLAHTNGAWIIPFLLDSSRINAAYAKKSQKPMGFLDSLRAINPFSPQSSSRRYFEPGASPDLEKTSPAMYLPKPDTSDFHLTRQSGTIQLSYSSQKATQAAVFSQQFFTLPLGSTIDSVDSPSKLDLSQSKNIITLPPITLSDNKLAWTEANYHLFGLELSVEADTYKIRPFFQDQLDWDTVVNRYAYVFDPEAHAQPLAINNTVLYAHNPKAIAGNNPIRFILQGYDTNNLPVPIKNISVDAGSDTSVSIELHRPTHFNGGWWIDISSQDSGTKNIKFHFDDHSLTAPAHFIENCAVHLKKCLLHPHQGAQFLVAKFASKIKTLK